MEGGREGGRDDINVIHIIIGMFYSNQMTPHYLNNNLTLYYVIT